MKSKPVILSMLNTRLSAELSAMDLYLLQGRMLENWGFRKLQERFVHESSDERGHADRLIQRILFLDGEPDLAPRLKLSTGKNVKEMLDNALEYELEVATALNAGIALSEKEGDNGTRHLLEQLLKDTEEDHIFWLESQLKLIASLGLDKYLAQQL
jgi:bacterioferritin